jgi:hypothetical protein
MKTNPDHSIFPARDGKVGIGIHLEIGMTKREEFAKAAMMGILSHTEPIRLSSPFRQRLIEGMIDEVTSLSVKMADALVEALNA